EPAPAPPPPLAAASYPREVIARPLTLPAGVGRVGGGVAVTARDDTVSAAGAVGPGYASLALAGASYGVTSRVEVTGELALDAGGARSSLAFAQVSASLVRGPIYVALRGTLGLALDAGMRDVRLGVPLRLRIADRIALLASD